MYIYTYRWPVYLVCVCVYTYISIYTMYIYTYRRPVSWCVFQDMYTYVYTWTI